MRILFTSFYMKEIIFKILFAEFLIINFLFKSMIQALISMTNVLKACFFSNLVKTLVNYIYIYKTFILNFVFIIILNNLQLVLKILCFMN